MFNFNSRKVYVYTKYVDMRKQFNGLISLTDLILKMDSRSNDLYLFFNKRKNYIKILFWDRTGYCILSKKLERGTVSLDSETEVKEIDISKLKLILDGIKLGRKQ